MRMKTTLSLLAALVLGLSITTPARAASEDVVISLENLSVSKADMVCMALNDYWEARGETMAGRLAVAQVVLNRVEDRRFPDNICDVVKHSRSWRLHRCQFSWYCDGRSDVPRNVAAWERSLSLATSILQSGYVRQDKTKGALWYHADYVSPSWATRLHESKRLGSHIFYTETEVRQATASNAAEADIASAQ